MHQPEPIALLSAKLQAAGFVHGFFTRNGGSSLGPYSSLNCSFSVGDDPNRVELNLQRIANTLGVAHANLVTVSQVHGATAEHFSESLSVGEFANRLADAVTGRASDFALAIRTADCVPVLVGCTTTGAVAAIHAGWRGLVEEVIPRTIASLVEQGSKPGSLIACVGPHIGLNAFEVSEDVALALHAKAPAMSIVRRLSGRKPHVDLGLLAATQLKLSGLREDSIETLLECTYSNAQGFFSYRRDGKTSGRQLSAIRPLQTTLIATSRTIK
jgi:hypothetical protein